MITVYTTGVFDLLHRGHINILTKARELGDRLVVGVQADESATFWKGKRPVLSTQERVEQLTSLPFVDEVLVYEDVDQIPNYEKVKPDVVVQGDDWIQSGDRTRLIQYLKEHHIRLVLFPYTQGISSTEIKRRIVGGEQQE